MPPHKYEAMRDRFSNDGMSRPAAKKKAARIYNSQRKSGQAPVTPANRKKEKRKKTLADMRPSY